MAIYLSATTDRQGSGVYIIFSSTDLQKILIACKCSTFNMLEIFSYILSVYCEGRKKREKLNDLILKTCMIQTCTVKKFNEQGFLHITKS